MAEEWKSARLVLRCRAVRRQNAARDGLPVPWNGQRALPAARWLEHRAEDRGGDRAHPAGGNEARPLYPFGAVDVAAREGGLAADAGHVLAGVDHREGGSVARSGGGARVPGYDVWAVCGRSSRCWWPKAQGIDRPTFPSGLYYDLRRKNRKRHNLFSS